VDAVAFAADKLATHREAQPVARILVVISDGEDNSSSITLKQAIARAQHDEVAVYTVSTGEGLSEEPGALLGDHALRTLSELTGGAVFTPIPPVISAQASPIFSRSFVAVISSRIFRLPSNPMVGTEPSTSRLKRRDANSRYLRAKATTPQPCHPIRLTASILVLQS